LDIKRRGVQDLSWTSKEGESKIYLGRQKKRSPRFILDIKIILSPINPESKIYLGRQKKRSPRFILDVKRRGVQDLSWTSKEEESKIYLGRQKKGSPRFILDIKTLDRGATLLN
jgi:hypothetical protein